MRELAAGRYGERAGDVLMIANNGNVEQPGDRRYFAGLYHSWHGSPSRQDSEVPLIVAHPRRSAHELKLLTERVLGPRPRHQDIARLIEQLLLPR